MLKRRRPARRTLLILTRGSCKLCCFFLRAASEAYDASDVFKDDFHDARP